MQYHPTGAAYPEQILGQLVTEKVRGLGAQVVNIDGEQFVYPLETRDVESAAFIRECAERKRGVATHGGQAGVWLDSPMIDILHGPGTIARELPAMVRQYQRFGIDMTQRCHPRLPHAALPERRDDHAARRRDRGARPVRGRRGERRRARSQPPDGQLAAGHNGLWAAGRASSGGLCRHSAPQRRSPWRTWTAWEQARRDAGLADGILSPVLLPDYARHPERPVQGMEKW